MSKFLAQREAIKRIEEEEPISLIYPGEKGIIHVSNVGGDYFLRACGYKHSNINKGTILYVVKALMDKGYVASLPISSGIAYPPFQLGESPRDYQKRVDQYDAAVLEKECGKR